MYRHDEKQLKFENFHLPFDGQLRSDNRWARLAKQIPWQEIEDIYSSSLSGTGQGSPALSARIALGALIIVERRQYPREDCLESTFYASGRGVYEGLIKDIGEKGVFIATKETHMVGDVITVAVPSSNGKKGVKLRGEIVRQKPGGFGVHFKSHLNE